MHNIPLPFCDLRCWVSLDQSRSCLETTRWICWDKRHPGLKDIESHHWARNHGLPNSHILTQRLNRRSRYTSDQKRKKLQCRPNSSWFQGHPHDPWMKKKHSIHLAFSTQSSDIQRWFKNFGIFFFIEFWSNHFTRTWMNPTRWCPSSLAFSWIITPMSLWFMADINLYLLGL